MDRTVRSYCFLPSPSAEAPEELPDGDFGGVVEICAVGGVTGPGSLTLRFPLRRISAIETLLDCGLLIACS